MGQQIYFMDEQGLVEIFAAPSLGWTADEIKHNWTGLTPEKTPTELMGWPDAEIFWHDWDGVGQIGLVEPLTSTSWA